MENNRGKHRKSAKATSIEYNKSLKPVNAGIDAHSIN
jgi:hypothetical protein